MSKKKNSKVRREQFKDSQAISREGTRTISFQLDADSFEKFEDYLSNLDSNKKEFLTEYIESCIK